MKRSIADCGEAEVRCTGPLVGFNFKLETKLETRHAANGRCHRDALKVSAPIPSTLALPFIARLSADCRVADRIALETLLRRFSGSNQRLLDL